MAHAALLLAAGRGSRIQEVFSDKVLAPLRGRPVIAYSAAAFRKSPEISLLAVTYRDETQKAALAAAVHSTGWQPKEIIWIQGGNERQDSVLHGLQALPTETELVFIHDAARPMLTPKIIGTLAAAATKTGAACLARRVTDTIKETAPEAESPTPLRTIDRSRLWAMETPQVFRYTLILAAYEKAHASGQIITDDTASLEAAGDPVTLVENPHPNPKLTTPADHAYLEYLLQKK